MRSRAFTFLSGQDLTAAGVCLAFLLVLVVGSSPAAAVPAGEVSFRNEVMAILSKAGCNAGTCHGNANGKAGFKLSLRGEDPDWDFKALTHDMFARRVNGADPDQSLVLLKATTQIAHEGGLRFRKDSDEYRALRRWISAGLSADTPGTPKLQRLEVT